MSHSKPQWYRLPAAALEDIKLTRSALLLLAVLIDQSDYGAAELTIPELCNLAGIGATACKDALRQLRGADLIEIERTGRASRYTVREILPPKQRRPLKQRSRSRNENSSIDPELLESLMNPIGGMQQ